MPLLLEFATRRGQHVSALAPWTPWRPSPGRATGSFLGCVRKDGWLRTRAWAAVVALLVVACGPAAEQGEQEGDETSSVEAAMEHELGEEALWISEDGDAEQAAEEFLDQVLGWSTEPVARVIEGSEEMELEPTSDMVEDTAEIDLAALGVDEFEPDPNSSLLTTVLLVHFDEDGQTVAAEGHPIRARPIPG